MRHFQGIISTQAYMEIFKSALVYLPALSQLNQKVNMLPMLNDVLLAVLKNQKQPSADVLLNMCS